MLGTTTLAILTLPRMVWVLVVGVIFVMLIIYGMAPSTELLVFLVVMATLLVFLVLVSMWTCCCGMSDEQNLHPDYKFKRVSKERTCRCRIWKSKVQWLKGMRSKEKEFPRCNTPLDRIPPSVDLTKLEVSGGSTTLSLNASFPMDVAEASLVKAPIDPRVKIVCDDDRGFSVVVIESSNSNGDVKSEGCSSNGDIKDENRNSNGDAVIEAESPEVENPGASGGCVGVGFRKSRVRFMIGDECEDGLEMCSELDDADKTSDDAYSDATGTSLDEIAVEGELGGAVVKDKQIRVLKDLGPVLDYRREVRPRNLSCPASCD